MGEVLNSHKDYGYLAEWAPALIWMCDLEGCGTLFNRAWLDFTGRTLEQELGHGWIESIHPHDREAATAACSAAIARREPFRIQWRMRRADGEYRWIVDNGVPCFSPEGMCQGFVGSCVDITDERAATEILQATQSRLRAIIDAVPALISYIDRDGRYLLTNRAYDEWFGHPQGTLAGRAAEEVLGPAVWSVAGPKMDAAFSGQPVRFEAEVDHRDGRRRWVDAAYSPEIRSDGQVCGVVVLVQDITARKENELALRESEQKFRLLFERSLDAIVVADNDGNFRLANSAAATLFGQPLERLLTMNIADLRTMGAEPAHALYRRYLAVGEEVGEFCFVLSDGGVRVAEYAAAEVNSGWHLSILRDVTERKRSESLLRLRAAQQAAVAALGQRALTSESLQDLMDRSVAAVAEVLGNQCARVLELLPGENKLLLRSGIGWKDGLVGHATVSAERDSQAGYALLAGGPVIVEDVATESRFQVPPMLFDHELISGISCPIFAPVGVPYGVLSSHSKVRREFSNDDANFVQSVANIIGSAIQRERTARALRDREERLRAIVETAADAIITIDQTGTIESFNSAAETMFGYAAAEMIGQNVSLLMPSPYREEHGGYLARYFATGEPRLIGRVRRLLGMRKDGAQIPIELSVSEIDHTGRFAGIVRDVSARDALQNELLTIAEAEQRRIGEDLHDDVGQELTGLGLNAATLLEALDEYGLPETAIASRIVSGLQRTHEKVRLLSHGLVPVEVDAGGLMSALAELATRVAEADGMSVTLDCPQPVTVSDNRIATNLFRIAQEAVSNAVRHANARQIFIRLRKGDRGVKLEVRDDGIGISERTTSGDGLRIMRHRADLIGANLRLERASGGGTRVVCTIWERER